MVALCPRSRQCWCSRGGAQFEDSGIGSQALAKGAAARPAWRLGCPGHVGERPGRQGESPFGTSCGLYCRGSGRRSQATLLRGLGARRQQVLLGHAHRLQVLWAPWLHPAGQSLCQAAPGGAGGQGSPAQPGAAGAGGRGHSRAGRLLLERAHLTSGGVVILPRGAGRLPTKAKEKNKLPRL